MALPDASAIERAGLKAWPGLEVTWDGAWVCRASNGYTKRANSVQCFDPTDDANVAERVAAACRWFEVRHLRPIFRVNHLTGPALSARLEAEGWAVFDQSRVLAMELDEVALDPRARVLPVTDPAFLEAQRRLNDYDELTFNKLCAILNALAVPARGVVLRADDGHAVASALMAIADGIVITGNVVRDAAARRQGYASAMLRSGLAWAVDAGAGIAVLNVQADNVAALRLYGSLGYRHQYDYVYRICGAA